MKNMWEKHTIGKRILALCLLVTMLFDTVTASAMNVNGEDIQMELLETEPALEGSEEIVPETGVLEEMEASLQGDPIEIAFNAKYITDVIRNINDSDLCMKFNSNVSPCVVVPQEGDQYLYLILPVRVFQ